jgi:hypothetical protein
MVENMISAAESKNPPNFDFLLYFLATFPSKISQRHLPITYGDTFYLVRTK